MTKRKLAVVYVVMGSIVCIAALAGIVFLWSSSVLPVRIAGIYVLGNRVLRYALYILLAYISYKTGRLAYDGYEYLR